jgi:hypothetical protein
VGTDANDSSDASQFSSTSGMGKSNPIARLSLKARLETLRFQDFKGIGCQDATSDDQHKHFDGMSVEQVGFILSSIAKDFLTMDLASKLH